MHQRLRRRRITHLKEKLNAEEKIVHHGREKPSNNHSCSLSPSLPKRYPVPPKRRKRSASSPIIFVPVRSRQPRNRPFSSQDGPFPCGKNALCTLAAHCCGERS